VKASGQARGVQIALVQADHSNNVPRSLLTEQGRTSLAADNLTGYVGHANGYVLTFTNRLAWRRSFWACRSRAQGNVPLHDLPIVFDDQHACG
jgi:hypothetical protein